MLGATISSVTIKATAFSTFHSIHALKLMASIIPRTCLYTSTCVAGMIRFGHV